jgi:hypothetical protein
MTGRVWSLVIEFDSQQDYDEFVYEHVQMDCSDVREGSYRVVMPPARATPERDYTDIRSTLRSEGE